MAIKRKTAKNIGFFSALSVLIGSVIGIGIFFKNGSVFGSNGFNGIGVLISWILAAVVATATAFSFAEISSSTRSKAGLAKWAELFAGKKIGYFIKLSLPIFYFGILIPAIFIFAAESIFNIFDIKSGTSPNGLLSNTHIGYVFLVALVLFVIILFTNVKYKNLSRKSQFVLTITKFLPLVATIIIGLIFASTKGVNLITHPGKPLPTPDGGFIPNPTPTPIDFSGILASLPAILFAFDSFLAVGSLSKEMKNGEKKIPLVIVIGMVFCSMIYLLITISQILIGQGVIGDFYNFLFSGDPTLAFSLELIIDIFMFLSIVGVANGLTLASIRNFDYLVKSKIVYKYDVINRVGRKHEFLSGAILLFIVFMFWFTSMLIPSAIINTDVLVDGMSNYPTLFFFLVYGLVIFFALLNRWKKKINVNKVRLFIPISIISLIGIIIIFGYQIFYENLAKLIIDYKQPISWGVLMDRGHKFLAWQGAIVFFVSIFCFFTIPFLNKFLFKAERKINYLIAKKEITKMVIASNKS
ncbi:MAG: APC family permease [Malacoplasma sp.]